jgi:transcriptional regulator with XRE-family HTH domain
MRTGKRAARCRGSHTRIPALPFCQLQLATTRPVRPGYPRVSRHIGDHLRKRRLDLNLLQREVAERLGASPAAITNWELGHTAPALAWMPHIIRFLGYDPRPMPEAIGSRLKAYRRGRGVSQEAMARQLGIDPGTLARWERGSREPRGEYLARAEGVLAG